MMERVFLQPGEAVCDVMKLPPDSDHRQVLRMFVNTLFWGAVGVAAVAWFMLL
jgi:hypothetical protein